jgi:hypothetical protein
VFGTGPATLLDPPPYLQLTTYWTVQIDRVRANSKIPSIRLSLAEIVFEFGSKATVYDTCLYHYLFVT